MTVKIYAVQKFPLGNRGDAYLCAFVWRMDAYAKVLSEFVWEYEDVEHLDCYMRDLQACSLRQARRETEPLERAHRRYLLSRAGESLSVRRREVRRAASELVRSITAKNVNTMSDSEVLRSLLQRSGVTQEALGRELGCDRRAIRAIRDGKLADSTGRAIVSQENLERIMRQARAKLGEG